MSSIPYVLDSDAPRAPTEEQWREMDAHAREQVLASLPSELPRTSPPEGDAHRIPKTQALETLDEHFRRTGRSVYLSSELPVYYPGETVFAPDLIDDVKAKWESQLEEFVTAPLPDVDEVLRQLRPKLATLLGW